MLVEIHNNSASDTLTVYKIYHKPCMLSEIRPLCSIYEDDFFELLPEREFNNATDKGKIHFEVNKAQLLDKAKRIL